MFMLESFMFILLIIFLTVFVRIRGISFYLEYFMFFFLFFLTVFISIRDIFFYFEYFMFFYLFNFFLYFICKWTIR